MTEEEGYQEAEERIAKAQHTGAKELNLSYLGLTELPEALWQLTKLESLDVSGNRIYELPEALGQLTQLRKLFIFDNRLSVLPEALSKLPQLRKLIAFDNQLMALPDALRKLNQLELLRVEGNHLPAEILRLSKERKLIGYLRELAQTSRTKRAAGEAPARFDEAKLLLVGPGDVGKSWLLQALQGKVPTEVGSTKGLEIARQPLDLPHSSEAGRTLHLNCWDFGGQPWYEITHQIFFSPKAVYLLVWKPRSDSTPDLVTRLERIQLSAGRTARVFIVSTHADGNVPPVIGKRPLLDRFGELIGGFHAIDSAKGPEGTGMAALKSDIAKAVAQLEGMDLPFPVSWHAAQQTVRKLDQPTLSFGKFEQLCAEQGMKHEDASALASIMDVQGNAVYFAEAPGKAEAGVEEAENLVVLNPEWLAKAVAFLIEDKETLHESGLLLHSRLPEIWHKDPQRGCPGYAREIHGYLLWLIWKFDIAYRQNAETSLVPELIHRNRPDGLLHWTPLVDSQEPQATLIARVPQTPPAGLVPVLTAAVHPLRRIQCPKPTDDKLDQNWRDGFFLDTALRGTAFVELQDRDLRIVVRHKYPASLLQQLRRTLDEAVSKRWPQLKLDYRVPCIGQKDGKPCPGTFRWERLAEKRGERMYCEECGDDLEVKKMLDGFDVREATVLQSIRELKDGQSDLLAVALRLYRAVHVHDPARRGRLEPAGPAHGSALERNVLVRAPGWPTSRSAHRQRPAARLSAEDAKRLGGESRALHFMGGHALQSLRAPGGDGGGAGLERSHAGWTEGED